EPADLSYELERRRSDLLLSRGLRPAQRLDASTHELPPNLDVFTNARVASPPRLRARRSPPGRRSPRRRGGRTTRKDTGRRGAFDSVPGPTTDASRRTGRGPAPREVDGLRSAHTHARG